LANRRRLTGAVDPHHQHDGRRSLDRERTWPSAYLSRPGGPQGSKRVGGRTQVGARRLAAQVANHPLGGGHTGVGGDQGRFEVVPESVIECGTAEDFLEIGDVALTTGLEGLRKAFPESLALAGRLVI